MTGTIRIGIGGWIFPAWRGSFYPPGLPQARELEHASRRLRAIEINGTFYRTQSRETFRRWRDETPEGFVFTLKAPRYATNRRVLAEAGPSIETFFASGVTELGDRLGPVNWQFADSKKYDPGDFAAFLDLLPREVDGRRIRHAVEMRHESFLVPEVVSLLRKRGIAAVVDGDAKYPMLADVTADFVYLRIQGTREGAKAGYPPRELDRWADRARTWAAGGVPEDLPALAPAPPRKPRDVFLFVIGGFKDRNPTAAEALTRRLE